MSKKHIGVAWVILGIVFLIANHYGVEDMELNIGQGEKYNETETDEEDDFKETRKAFSGLLGTVAPLVLVMILMLIVIIGFGALIQL